MPIAIIAAETEKELEDGKGERMLTRTQAAARLGVTERRISHFVTAGELTPWDERLFHVPIFPESSIEQLRISRLRRYAVLIGLLSAPLIEPLRTFF